MKDISYDELKEEAYIVAKRIFDLGMTHNDRK